MQAFYLKVLAFFGKSPLDIGMALYGMRAEFDDVVDATADIIAEARQAIEDAIADQDASAVKAEAINKALAILTAAGVTFTE